MNELTYAKNRIKCLESERNHLINCLKVALTLVQSTKECKHYLEAIIKREEDKNVHNIRCITTQHT